METLDLSDYANVKSDNLSGGNKRKLVCAMSLLACPCVEFLDEPTTGVDPVSRRSLFKMLKQLPQCSLILTTHRMDEAEALCDNIAIMINGRFVVFGSPSHLKSTYGLGYSLTLNTCEEPMRIQAREYVTANMPYLEFKDHFVSKEKKDNKDIVENLF
jgi:ATP-binding cassette, subfamily A (ABC1), member 3